MNHSPPIVAHSLQGASADFWGTSREDRITSRRSSSATGSKHSPIAPMETWQLVPWQLMYAHHSRLSRGLSEASKSAVERARGFHGSRDSAVVRGVEAGPGSIPWRTAQALWQLKVLGPGERVLGPFPWLLCAMEKPRPTRSLNRTDTAIAQYRRSPPLTVRWASST